MKNIKSKSEIPTVKHFAIIEFNTITIPGDNRSLINPGHGYPEHTENMITYFSFVSEEEWLTEVENRTVKGQSNFVAMLVNPAVVYRKTMVEIQY